MRAFSSIAITMLFMATAGLVVSGCSQGQQREQPVDGVAQESDAFPQQSFQSADPSSSSYRWQLPQTESVEPEFPPINTWQPPTFSQPSPPVWSPPPLPQFYTPEISGGTVPQPTQLPDPFALPSESQPPVVPQIIDPLPSSPSVTPTWPSIPMPSYPSPSTLPSVQPDYDCADFQTQGEAQMFFMASGLRDPYGLDSDHDGIACESLPKQGPGEKVSIPTVPNVPATQPGFNCANFSSQSEAQMIFDLSGPGDPYHLDGDHDGQACEDLP